MIGPMSVPAMQQWYDIFMRAASRSLRPVAEGEKAHTELSIAFVTLAGALREKIEQEAVPKSD